MKRFFVSIIMMMMMMMMTIGLLAAGSLAHAQDDSRVLSRFANFEVRESIELKDIQGGNLSGITYNFDTDTYFLMQNNYESMFEYDKSFSKQLRVIKMLNLEDDDTEDIVYLGGGRFALSSETNKIILFSIAPGQTVVDLRASRHDVQLLQLPAPGTENQGLEGVCYAAEKANAPAMFYAVQQDRPRKVYSFLEPSPSFNIRDPKKLGLREPFDSNRLFKHRMRGLSSCYFSDATDTLLILSSGSSRIMELSLDGLSVSTLDIPALAPQYEGITMNPEGEIVLVSEPNKVVVLRPKPAN